MRSKANRADERLFKRILPTGDHRHYERGHGRGGRVLAGPHKFRICAVHSGGHFARPWGERSRDLATHGAIGTADHAARLTECKLFTKALNALKTTFPKWLKRILVRLPPTRFWDVLTQRPFLGEEWKTFARAECFSV